MRRRSIQRAALAFALAASGVAGAAEPPPIIEKVLEAYGGRERLAAVRAYKMEGQVLAGHGEAANPTTRLFARPDKLKISIQRPARTEVRIVDGARGWRNGAQGELLPAGGPLLDSMVLQAARADLPWILMERGEEFVAAELATGPAAGLISLTLVLTEGLELRAYVDPKSGTIVRAATVLNRGGISTGFEAVFSAHRVVDGVLFAFREENYAGGSRTATTAFDKVTLNPSLTPGEFAP